MNHEYLVIAPAPAEEQCAQVGTPEYPDRSHIECRVFKRMLLRLFPLPQGVDVALIVKTFPHDAGEYREVCARFADRRGADYAYMVEAALPAQWDDIARAELVWYERKHAYRWSVASKSLTLDEVPEAYRDSDPPENVLDLVSASAATSSSS